MGNNQKTSDILPCPLCGSDVETEISPVSMISCKNQDCGLFLVDTDSPFIDEARDKWNKRALDKYLSERVAELTKENMRLTEQLHHANEVALFYASFQSEVAHNGPMTFANFNMATSYCHKYALPVTHRKKEESDF